MEETGFIRKKVASLTLGEKLQKFRTEHRMSLAEVSRATKIQIKYLEALEAGIYAALPADVYVRGFLRSYARHLGCDEEVILRLYERERHIQTSLGKGGVSSPSRQSSGARSGFVVTAKMVWGVCGTVVLVSAFWYLLSEYQAFVQAPRLIVTEPSNQSVVSQAELKVRGETDSNARVLINGQTASVNMQGEFSEDVLLQPGVNTILVSASNRFGKDRVETIHVEAVFPAEQADQNEAVVASQDIHKVRLVLSAPEQAVTVTVVADGTKVLSGKLEIGDHKEIVADHEIRVSSDNGRATYVAVGSESPQPLSSEEQPVKDILFTQTP